MGHNKGRSVTCSGPIDPSSNRSGQLTRLIQRSLKSFGANGLRWLCFVRLPKQPVNIPGMRVTLDGDAYLYIAKDKAQCKK